MLFYIFVTYSTISPLTFFQNKVSVDFDVRYRILGHRNLGKVFGLFQVGREVVITGYISGFEDKGSRVWIVTVIIPIFI
jgi:hypothetical protein